MIERQSNVKWLEDLVAQYPDEFKTGPETMKQILKDCDQRIAVEEGFLDNPDRSFYVPAAEEDIPEIEDEL